MIGPYLEQHEIEQLDELLKHDDTIGCWIGTRLDGIGSSWVCDGNVSIQLLKMLDEKILPLIKNK